MFQRLLHPQSIFQITFDDKVYREMRIVSEKHPHRELTPEMYWFGKGQIAITPKLDWAEWGVPVTRADGRHEGNLRWDTMHMHSDKEHCLILLLHPKRTSLNRARCAHVSARHIRDRRTILFSFRAHLYPAANVLRCRCLVGLNHSRYPRCIRVYCYPLLHWRR